MATNKLYAIILAGGASSRMGRWKGGLPWGKSGKSTLITEHERGLIDLGAELVVSVVPHAEEDAAAGLVKGPAVIQNDAAAPLTSSLQLGLQRITEQIAADEIERTGDEPNRRYLIMVPVDTAPLSAGALKLIWKIARKSKAKVVRPVVLGSDIEEEEDEKLWNGHPVLLEESLWEPILKSDPQSDRIDHMIREVPLDQVRGVDLNDLVHPWLVLRSMNTPEEYDELKEISDSLG